MIRSGTKVAVPVGVAPDSIWDFPERAVAWPAAFLIIATTLINDTLVLWYLAPLFPALRFAILPVGCVVHLLWNLGSFVINIVRGRRYAIPDAFSMVVPVACLITFYLWPFPLWTIHLKAN